MQINPALSPESYFVSASGDLGWTGPAAVGVTLGHKKQEEGHRELTILTIGDGSCQYLVRSIYTAVQGKGQAGHHRAPQRRVCDSQGVCRA
jgi:TPP-dependent 2-oxoacid decarboxylase